MGNGSLTGCSRLGIGHYGKFSFLSYCRRLITKTLRSPFAGKRLQLYRSFPLCHSKCLRDQFSMVGFVFQKISESVCS